VLASPIVHPPTVDQARRHPSITIAVLALGVLAYTLSQTTVAPALPHIQHALGISASSVTWTLSAYLVSASVMTPIVGRLGDMFGKKRLLVVTLVAFAAGSALCAVAGSIGVLIAGRVIQGAAGGLFPLAFAILRDELPGEKVAASIGLVSSITGIGGGAGLVLGGVIVDNASWHWIFWVALAMTLIALVATYALVPESPVTTPGRVDWGGAALLGAGLSGPLIGVSESTTWGWGDARTLGLIALGIPLLAALVAFERRRPQPLLDMVTLARRPVLATNAATVLIGFAMFGSFVLIPQIAQLPGSTGYGLGDTATVAGLLLLPSTAVMLIAAPLSGRIGAARGSRGPLVVGTLITASALGLLAVAHRTPLELIAAAALMGGGIGLAFAAMPNLIIEAVRREQTGEATAVNALVRNVGGALGAQISGTILAGSVLARTGLPAESGFATAFGVSAGVALLGAGLALLVPRRGAAAADPSTASVTLAAESDPAKALTS
jgi:EmrB/QacA subfamily drug resistance transporter